MTSKITVLIPAHNESDCIVSAVESVLNQNVPVRVIVIADSCTDDTAALARKAGAAVVEVAQGSKPKSLNIGLAQVETKYTAILDADCIYGPGWLSACLDAMEEHGYGGVCTSVGQTATQGLWQRARAIEWAAVHRVARRVESWHGWVAVLSGSAGVYRTHALRDVGGWSTDGLCEDVELAIKMNSSGHRAGFVPDATVYVRDPDSFHVYRRQVHRWAAGWAQAIDKHKGLFFRRYGFTAVFGALVGDCLLLLAAYFTLIWTVILGHTSGLAMPFTWVSVWWSIMTGFTFTMASRSIGVRETAKCFPAFLLVSTFSTMFGLWVMVRECVLRRHLTTWTGRQGRRPVMVWGNKAIR